MKETESNIQNAICDYLVTKKHFFWRNNNVPIYDVANKRMRRMPKHSINGTPDIIVIGEIGQFIGLEVKTKKGKLSESQKVFKKLCEKNQAEYYVVRSIDEVIAIGL